MEHLKNLCLTVVLPILFITVICMKISAKQSDGYPVSPALSVIASDMELKKCGLTDTDIYFSSKDFDDFLHTNNIKSITVTSLPSKFEGTLMLKDIPVISNQTIYKNDIKDLHFSPETDSISSSSFYFSVNSLCCESSVKCSMFLLPQINTSPTISVDAINGQKLSTQKNIMVYSTLQADDNENDPINYEIITEPKHGIVSLSNVKSGDFSYTPSLDFTGSDKFEYVAIDIYGNRSESAWMEIDVIKSSNNTFFSDMLRHEEHNAAVKASDYGIMSGKIVDGKLCFFPNYELTKAEFLSMALKAYGIKTDFSVNNTGFDDDSDIPIYLKECVAYAANTGIISGTKTDNGVFFYPNSAITRAEAAVIVNNILKVQSTSDNIVFNDSADIPSWAENDIISLAQNNIMKEMNDGNYMPNSNITNIQAAEIFCKMYEMNYKAK